MMDDTKTVYVVEVIVGKGDIFFGIRYLKGSRHVKQLEPFFRQFYGVWRQIKTKVACSISRKLKSVGANATADFKNVFIIEFIKLSYYWYVPFSSIIALVCDVFEIFSAIFQVRKIALTRICSIFGLSPSRGSSNSSSLGWAIRALPTASICCSPPLRKPPGLFLNLLVPEK